MNIRLLSGNDVTSVLPMAAAIELMRSAFIELSAGTADTPLRSTIHNSMSGNRTLVMPGHLPHLSSIGVKIVSVQPRNASHGIPTIHAIMTVIDAETGKPVAVLDGERLTAIRTGAASGLATDLLANPDACVAAIFGAGAQGETQLEAVATVRRLDHALVFERSEDRATRFSEKMSARLGIDVRPADSPARLRDADIICTATTSRQPVFGRDDVKAGVHINAIGSFTPDVAEVPIELVARCEVVVDQRAACLVEAGELVQAIREGLMVEDDVVGEIGEIAAGTVRGRSSPDAITLFKSVGNAVQDVAAAAYVVEQSQAKDLGRVFAL